jgi:hypothetical protein
MARKPSDQLPAKTKPTKLSVQGHEEIMDLLRLANKSSNPDIVKVATDLASQEMKYRHGRHDKTPPWVTVVLSTVAAVVAVAACWFVFTHYKEGVAVGLSIEIIAMAIFIIALYALTSGHLSQANFMTIFKWVGGQLRRLTSLKLGKSGVDVPLGEDVSIRAAEEPQPRTGGDFEKK